MKPFQLSSTAYAEIQSQLKIRPFRARKCLYIEHTIVACTRKITDEISVDILWWHPQGRLPWHRSVSNGDL